VNAASMALPPDHVEHVLTTDCGTMMQPPLTV
jgi:hypothetical protein